MEREHKWDQTKLRVIYQQKTKQGGFSPEWSLISYGKLSESSPRYDFLVEANLFIKFPQIKLSYKQ